jgi:hypothetical protein
MRKIFLTISIFGLILITSLVKNSTKKIEDQIFNLNESIRSLKIEFGDVLLEYNYLSSPEKLIKYHSQYFVNDLVQIDIMKTKEIKKRDGKLIVNKLIKETQDNE